MSGRNADGGRERTKRKGANLMSQMGMDESFGLEDDDDLEAELAELMGESPKKTGPKRKEKVDLSMIDKMAAEGMKSFDSDEEMSDTEDPELLAELADLAGQSPSPEKSPDMPVKPMAPVQPTFQAPVPQPVAPQPAAPQPIFMPTTSGSSSIEASGGATVPTMQPSSSSSADKQTHKLLTTRRDHYKQAALRAKHSNDIPTASKYVKIAKQFDQVITALEEGKEIDLSQMPPSPPPPQGPSNSAPNFQTNMVPKPSPVERSSMQAADEKPAELVPDLPETTKEEEREIFHAPDEPKSILEALEQRLAKYKSTEQQAKEKGDNSRVRRMGRIVKQYQDAIKCHKAGKPVDYEDLPTPPGFGPIPLGGTSTGPPPQNTAVSNSVPGGAVGGTSQSVRTSALSGASTPRAVVSPPAAQPAPSLHPSPQPRAQPPAVSPKQSTSSQGAPGRGESLRKGHSKSDQQLAFLKERYDEFKTCALNAKKNNDLELAKKYIRIMKGLEPMISAAESGLPVDLSQVPKSPNMPEEEDKFVIVAAEDCVPTGDRDQVFKKLEADLIQQIRTCVTNSQHYTKLGDVPAASKFQKLEQNCRKDLDALKNAFRHGDPVPRFHYETKNFSMVQCNTELGDNDLELVVVRGIQYNLPADYEEKKFDTYVTYEFPFPTEQSQTDHTSTVKGSINPEYEEHFKISIARKSRSFVRVIERKSLKLDVYYKRGFFKSEKVLGSINVKLQPLESNCEIHDSYDLMDGRKTVGGKLEVKLRIRDPIKSKQVEEVKEKWLIIDQFMRTAASKSHLAPPKLKNEGASCMEVLKFEKQQLDKQILALKDSLTEMQTQTLKHKSGLIQEKIELQQKRLREGGASAVKAYMAEVESEIPSYAHEAQQLTKVGEIQKAQNILTKKKLAEKELALFRSKFQNLQ